MAETADSVLYQILLELLTLILDKKATKEIEFFSDKYKMSNYTINTIM